MAAIETSNAGALVRLIYRSRSVLPGSSADSAATLSAILRSARANNPLQNITGVLLYDDFFFLQVIEGPLGNVEHIYEKIARDLRHEAIEVIDFLPVESREYTSFSMAFLHVTESCFPQFRHIMSMAPTGVASTLCSMISDSLTHEEGDGAERKQAVLF
jgi:hypothetical protein